MTKIVVSNFQFLDGKQDNPGGGDYKKYESGPDNKFQDQTNSHGTSWKPSNELEDEDIPF